MIIAGNLNSVCVDDWTAEGTMVASNGNSVCVDDWTAEGAIVASNLLENIDLNLCQQYW